MALFDWLKKKEAPVKPTFDFSNVQGGSSSVATPPVSPPASMAPQPSKYTVAKGDSLSKIAKKHYGNGNLWKKIYSANREVIGDNPDLIKPGQILVIPE